MTSDIMITDGIKQQVITRLATINSAISILNLTKGKPANVGVEEVLTLAERIEHWAWRDLLGERADTRAPEKPVPSKTEGPTNPALPTPLAKAEPQPPAKDDRPRATPWRGERKADQRNLRDREIQGPQQRRNHDLGQEAVQERCGRAHQPRSLEGNR